MKKQLLTIFSIFSLAANAQLTQANHAPAAGDPTYATYQCDSTGITGGASGAGVTWTYAITEHLSMQNTYTTSAYSGAAFSPADASVSSAVNNTLYYRSTGSELRYYGGDLSINSFEMSVKYASPATYAVYPMVLNTTTTTATSGTVNLTSPFPTSQAFTGTCKVLVDGTGVLALPSRTFTNVMKVVTTQTIVAGMAATVYLRNSDFYAVGLSKAPVLSVQESTINALAQPSSSQTIVTIQKNYIAVGVNENQKSLIELSLFPNPATNVVNFSTNSLNAHKVVAFDVTGKIVATELMEMGNAKINVSQLTGGIYMYQVLNKENELLKTGKFNVSK